MKQHIREFLARAITGHKDNFSNILGGPYFDGPLVNFASGDDPLFGEFKRIIGPWHQTPREAYEAAHGEGS